MTFSVWGSFGTTTPTRDVFATETFTVLKALTPPPSTLNVTIEVDGGVAKGDGLGGTFYYDPNSVLADDAVDVIAPTPVPTTGRWRRSVANIGFAVAVRLNIDGSANFVPAFDNVESIGTGSFRVQNGVFGASVMSPLYTALGDIVFTTGAPVRTITLSAANNNLGASSAMDLGTATLRWGTLFASAIDSGTSGAVAIKTNNGTTQVLVTHQGTAVNNVGLQGGATGTGVFVYSTGADTDVSLNLQSKAPGNINFLAYSGSTIHLHILRTASMNSNITETDALS